MRAIVLFVKIIIITSLSTAVFSQDYIMEKEMKGSSFIKYITFNNESSLIAYYVPDTYDSLVPNKMILALHYCGTSSSGSAIIYRNLLKELANLINVVIVAPDCHNEGPPHYNIPDPSIITVAIDSTLEFLNIDTTWIYLTGGSCNGKSTFEYGLDGIYDFIGIIPFNAWIPNIPPNHYNFDSEITTCICSGTLDPSYDQNVRMHDSLLSHNAVSRLNSMEGIGHEFNFPEFTVEMKECIDFIDSVYAHPVMSPWLEKYTPDVIIYPNPLTEILNIKVISDHQDVITIDIYDLRGQLNTLLFEGAIHKGITNISIDDIAEIPSGLNVIKITGRNWVRYEKVIHILNPTR